MVEWLNFIFSKIFSFFSEASKLDTSPSVTSLGKSEVNTVKNIYTEKGLVQFGNNNSLQQNQTFVFDEQIKNQNKRIISSLERVKLEITHNLQPTIGCNTSKFKIEEHTQLLTLLKEKGDRNDIIKCLKEIIETADACNQFCHYPPSSSSTPGIAKKLSKELTGLIDDYGTSLIHNTQ